MAIPEVWLLEEITYLHVNCAICPECSELINEKKNLKKML